MENTFRSSESSPKASSPTSILPTDSTAAVLAKHPNNPGLASVADQYPEDHKSMRVILCGEEEKTESLYEVQAIKKRKLTTNSNVIMVRETPKIKTKEGVDIKQFEFPLQSSPGPPPPLMTSTLKCAEAPPVISLGPKASKLDDKDGWFSAGKQRVGKQEGEMATHPLPSSSFVKTEEGDDSRDSSLPCSVAETIEKTLPVRSIAMKNVCGPSSRVSNDKRKFIKNYVRVACDSARISKNSMVLLLPKESERELQVPLFSSRFMKQDLNALL